MRRRHHIIYFADSPPLNFDGHLNDRALVSGNKSYLYRHLSASRIMSWRFCATIHVNKYRVTVELRLLYVVCIIHIFWMVCNSSILINGRRWRFCDHKFLKSYFFLIVGLIATKSVSEAKRHTRHNNSRAHRTSLYARHIYGWHWIAECAPLRKFNRFIVSFSNKIALFVYVFQQIKTLHSTRTAAVSF